MRRLLLFAAIWGAAYGQDAAEIVRKSLDRDQVNFERLKNYTYQERIEERELDAKGQVRKTTVEVYDILILAGRPHKRLISRDDKPLSPREESREREKMDAEAAKRKKETAADRSKQEKDRELERRYVREIPNAFELKIVGVDQISGRPAWRIEATPRKGYKPPSLPRANLLTKVRGKFWVDQKEFQWVKAEVEAVEALSFGLGLFRIAPGGAINFEQTRVNDEVWLPAHASIRADARVAFLKTMRGDYNFTYKDYRKFQAESKFVPGEEKK